MKRVVFGLATLLASAGCLPALAADPMVTPPANYSWSGLYAGGTLGIVSVNADVGNILFEGDDLGAPEFAIETNGGLAGVTLGLNQQWDNVVAGLEADYSWSNAEGSHTDPGPYNFTVIMRLQSLATLRGRLGLAVDGLLLYGTAGLAYGTVEGELHDVYQAGTVVTTDTQSMLGWTAGIGAEYAVADNVTLKAEGLYYDLGSATYEFYEGTDGHPWNPVSADGDIGGWLVRVGANFKF